MISLDDECRPRFRTSEHAFILRPGIEVQVQRINGQVDVDNIRRTDGYVAAEAISSSLNLNTFFSQRNVILLRLFQDGLADIRFRFRRIAVACGFVLQPVLKLVIVEVWWNYFHGNIRTTN